MRSFKFLTCDATSNTPSFKEHNIYYKPLINLVKWVTRNGNKMVTIQSCLRLELQKVCVLFETTKCLCDSCDDILHLNL